MGETDERKGNYGEEELNGIDGEGWHESAERVERLLWRVTGGEREKLRRDEERRTELEHLVKGLARCPVCKGPARVVLFGARGGGVWIGCDKTADCARHIEIHTEGWSIEEAAERWNRYNRGIFLCVRKVKNWWRKNIGAEGRRERAEKRVAAEKKRAREARLRELFGIKRSEGEKKWWRVW